MKLRLMFTSLIWVMTITPSSAQNPRSRPAPEASSDAKSGDKDKDKDKEDAPIVTHHEMTVGDRTLKYTATAGMLPIKDSKGDVEANIFYVAYTLGGEEASKRPLMFSFNGGPGSSSVWLHLGALGPKRVAMPSDAEFARPPFALQDNEATWLDKTDLVFIDPVGTGYSRAVKPELNAKFHGLQGDIESVGEFIRLYMTRENRWTSPIYLVGESYGTTRAAGLSDHLVEKGIALNGIVLVSSVLSFQTLEFDRGNDLPHVLYLPTYTATAWYHNKLGPDLQKDLKATLAEVGAWAEDGYAKALEKGDRLTADERKDVVNKLARYTGLSPEYVDSSNLRIEIMRFCKELLRKERRTVGRLDSRYKGIDAQNGGESIENDPSMSAIRPPYTATFNTYIREQLGYKTDVPYYILGEGTGRWDWGSQGRGGYPDTSAALRDALAKNPYLRVFVGSGYFDLATPYFATEYTIAHMNLDESQRKNFRLEYYDAGHMMYLHVPSLQKLKADVADFLK